MRESVDAAYSYVRSRAQQLGIPGQRVPRERSAHPSAGGRDSEGRSERGHHADAGDRQRAERTPGAPRRRDDRRGHAARQGARDRRREGEGARRVSRPACGRSSCRRRTRRICATCRKSDQNMAFTFVERMDEVLHLALLTRCPTSSRTRCNRSRRRVSPGRRRRPIARKRAGVVVRRLDASAQSRYGQLGSRASSFRTSRRSRATARR